METSNVTKFAKLCGINPKSRVIGVFSLSEYLQKFKKHDINPLYCEILFNYGCQMNYIFSIYEKKEKKFEEIDNEWSLVDEQINLLKFLLFGKEAVEIKIESAVESFKINHNPILKKKLIHSIISTTISDLNERGFFEITDEVISYLLFKMNFFSDWLEEWDYKDLVDNKLAIIEAFKMLHNVRFIKDEKDLSIEYLNLITSIIEQHYERLFGNKNKRIAPYKGNDNSDDAKKTYCHVVIQKLSLFLRIEEFYSSNQYKSIKDVTLTNKHCQFIYDFLNHFNIYFFEKESYTTSKSYTSTKAKLIKSRFNGFLRSQSSPIQLEEINTLINNIDKSK